MTGIRRFEDLECWQRARELDALIDQATDQKPLSNDVDLCDQMLRASHSVPSNIAEGFERNTDREFIRFLRIAKASIAELQSHLYGALDRHYLTLEEFDPLMGHTRRTARVTGGLIAYLVKKLAKAEAASKEGRKNRKR
jgi:four helix bundle protein